MNNSIVFNLFFCDSLIGNWILMVVHFFKQIEHSSLSAQSEALRSSWPDDKNGSLLFYITISSVVSYAIYFGAGGFLYVNFVIYI